MGTTATTATTDDVYQPTRLEDVKWRIGNRISAVAGELYERLTGLWDSLTGDGHETLRSRRTSTTTRATKSRRAAQTLADVQRLEREAMTR